MADRTLEYDLKAVDNVTPTARRAKKSQEELKESVKETNQAAQAQKIQFIENAVALSALREGIGGLQTSLTQLGVLEGEAAEKFMKMSAAVSLFVSTAQTIQGVIRLVTLLKSAELALAAVETYRAVLKNPAMIAVAVAGLTATAGVAGYYYGKNRAEKRQVTNNNQTTNITFNGRSSGQDSRGVTREVITMQGG